MLVLSRPQSDTAIIGDIERTRKKAWFGKTKWLLRMEATAVVVSVELKKAHVPYKKGLDRSIRRGNAEIKFPTGFGWMYRKGRERIREVATLKFPSKSLIGIRGRSSYNGGTSLEE